MSVDAILREVETLSETERAELLNRLQKQFPQSAADPLSDELKAELERRVAEADTNPDAGFTWDEVTAFVKRNK